MTFAALLLAACAGAPADPPAPTADDTSADPCADLRWDTVGGPFLLTWCAPCHAASLPPSRRQGAPPDVDLDTLSAALRWRDRILARTTGDAPTMPPAGGPTAAERERLAAWLACEDP